MNKSIRRMVCVLLSVCVGLLPASPVFAAAASSACSSKPGVVVAFFNGVQTTQKQARDVLERQTQEYGALTAAGEPVRYESFYNPTHGLEDFVETFSQRLAEQDGLVADRYETFWDVQQGGGSIVGKLTNAVPALARLFDSAVQDAQAYAVRLLTAAIANPPTQVAYSAHRARLDSLAIEGKKVLLFAHSQGNLFVNPAYDYLRNRLPETAIRVVHVAPASPRLTGRHTLADLDLVIQALRAVGSVADTTTSIPLVRQPGLNGKTDPLGHGLLEIYMNRSLNIRMSPGADQATPTLKEYVISSLNELQTPPATASSGFITASITWDGTGDVDLHSYEPDGTHVFWNNRSGHSGYLDVDNTSRNGPEHYYATCDAAQLQTGTYSFSIANFNFATGRTVTFQLHSQSDGILATRTFVLGGATGSVPSQEMARVMVTQDANGAFGATIVN